MSCGENIFEHLGPAFTLLAFGRDEAAAAFARAAQSLNVPLATVITFLTGDFNGDGKADLAVGGLASGSNAPATTILLGNGDGTFQDAVNYFTGVVPTSVEARDFNGDGKLDLAVANYGDDTAGILLGNGDGTFQDMVDYTTGPGPRIVTVSDLNGDGKLDLAVANSSGNTVSFLAGNGDGTFQAAVNYSAGASPRWVASGDLNGDGAPDLLVANQDNAGVSVLLNKGNGISASGSVILTGCVNWAQRLTFAFRPMGGASFTRTQMLTADGKFDVTNIPMGTYKLAIKGSKWLQRVLNVTVGNGNNSVPTITLLPGDVHEDNTINIDDLSDLVDAFFTAPDDPFWNENADLNCDDTVDVLDLSLLADSFFLSGDP